MNFRAAWNALLGRQVVVPAVEADRPEEHRGISEATLWEADRHNRPVISPRQMLTRPKPMDGIMPEGMAMDACLPAVNAVNAWGIQGIAHEGLAFLGYNYLAELAQRPEYRRMSEIRAEHATRKWIKLTGPDDAKIKAIDAEFNRLGVRAAFREALEQDGMFGRSQIFMDFGDFDNPKELSRPLYIGKGKISKKRPLKCIKTVEPMWSYPGPYESTNPLAPTFYKPDAWYVYGDTVSATRMLTFVGREVPDMLKPAYAFGGLSLTQMAKPYVDNWIRTRQSVSDLVSAFSQMVLKTNLGSILSGVAAAAQSLWNRVDLFNKTRNNRGTMVIDKNTEELQNVTTPLSGLADLQSQSQEQMSSVSGIPLVILLCVTPSGLNASSDGEVRSFYADIKANEQERTCRPNLQIMLEVVQLSLFDEIDPEIGFEFEDLWEMSEKDKAEIRKADAESSAKYVDMGAVSNEEVRERLSTEEGGMYQGLTGPAPVVEEEAEEDDAGAVGGQA